MVDVYYDCPCGHRHSEHDWRSPHAASCLAVGCPCWMYHGHRFGDEPFDRRLSLDVEPTVEMRSAHVRELARLLIQIALDPRGTEWSLDN